MTFFATCCGANPIGYYPSEQHKKEGKMIPAIFFNQQEAEEQRIIKNENDPPVRAYVMPVELISARLSKIRE